MTRDEILNMPAGREMDVTVGFHVMDLHALPAIYPDYSTDITDAWEVFRRLGEGWQIRQYKTSFVCVQANEWNEGILIEASTTPLAICRAALLAVMEAK